MKDRAQTFGTALSKDSRLPAMGSFNAALAALDKISSKHRFLDGGDKLTIFDISAVAVLSLIGRGFPAISAPPFDKAPSDTPYPHLVAFLKRTFAALEDACQSHQSQIQQIRESEVPALLSAAQRQALSRSASSPSSEGPKVGSEVDIRTNDSRLVAQSGELVHIDNSLAAIESKRADTKGESLRIWVPRIAYTVESRRESRL